MTLEEAGKLYNAQEKKLEAVRKNLRILADMFKAADNMDPMGRPTTLIVRTDILESIFSQLDEHRKHIEHVMNKEI